MPEQMPMYAIVGIILIGFAAILPIGAAILFIGLWVGRVNTTATNAAKDAEVARDRAQQLSNDLMAYKNQVALEYVRHEALKEVEGRITAAVNDLRLMLERVLTTRASS
jgi:hypothetical protein